MDREKLKDIVYIIVAVLVSIVAIKLFIWLLPIILIALFAIYLYAVMKNKDRKSKYYKEDNKTKRKKIVIIDEEKD